MKRHEPVLPAGALVIHWTGGKMKVGDVLVIPPGFVCSQLVASNVSRTYEPGDHQLIENDLPPEFELLFTNCDTFEFSWKTENPRIAIHETGHLAELSAVGTLVYEIADPVRFTNVYLEEGDRFERETFERRLINWCIHHRMCDAFENLEELGTGEEMRGPLTGATAVLISEELRANGVRLVSFTIARLTRVTDGGNQI